MFAVTIAAGDIIKYQSFVYGSFVWGIHVRYNKIKYVLGGLKKGLVWDVSCTRVVISVQERSRFGRFFYTGGNQCSRKVSFWTFLLHGW